MLFSFKLYSIVVVVYIGFPGGSDGKESACNAEDLGSIPRSGRPPGEGNANVLALRIPWIEEPGRLQSMGSQSQAWLSDLYTHTHTHIILSPQKLLQNIE